MINLHFTGVMDKEEEKVFFDSLKVSKLRQITARNFIDICFEFKELEKKAKREKFISEINQDQKVNFLIYLFFFMIKIVKPVLIIFIYSRKF